MTEGLAAELALKSLGTGLLHELEAELNIIILGFVGMPRDRASLGIMERKLATAVRSRLGHEEVETTHDAANGCIEVLTSFKGGKLQFRVSYASGREKASTR